MQDFASSFVSGLAHPLHGADHLFALLSVGVCGAFAGGRAIRVWPVAFVATMLAGFATAAARFTVSLVEPAIWLSVVVLGLVIALAVNAPLWSGAAVIGLFAFFHGHAHGTEAATANLFAYATGLALTTGTLHAAGIALCRIAGGPMGRVGLRALGGAAVVGGLAAMVALT